MDKTQGFKLALRDVLKEFGNIGTGSASYALSHMLDRKIYINIPSVSIFPISEIKNRLFPDNQLQGALYFEILGDADGCFLLIFDDLSIRGLLNYLKGNRERDFDQLGTEDVSCLEEIANIIICSYLRGLGSLLNIKLMPSIPSFAYDHIQSLIDFAIVRQSLSFTKSMVIDTEFRDNKSCLRIRALFFPGILLNKLIYKKYEIYPFING